MDMWICSNPKCIHAVEAPAKPDDHCSGFEMVRAQELQNPPQPEPTS